MLFEIVCHFAPDTIFLDKINTLINIRKEGPNKYEANKQLNNDLLL